MCAGGWNWGGGMLGNGKNGTVKTVPYGVYGGWSGRKDVEVGTGEERDGRNGKNGTVKTVPYGVYGGWSGRKDVEAGTGEERTIRG